MKVLRKNETKHPKITVSCLIAQVQRRFVVVVTVGDTLVLSFFLLFCFSHFAVCITDREVGGDVTWQSGGR